MSNAVAVRQADAVYMLNNLSPWYNATTGTIVAKTLVGYNIPAGKYQHVFTLSDTTWNNYITVYYSTGYCVVKVYMNGSNLGEYPFLTSALTSNTIIVSYSSGNLIFSINGVILFNGSIATPQNIVRLDVGSILGSNYLNGTIEYLTYYPKQLSVQEHQQLSSQ